MAAQVPHSWPLIAWPADVYPNDTRKARHMLRCYKDELVRAGALVRVGRQLVIIGSKYEAWLQGLSAKVAGFECPANRDRDTNLEPRQ